MIKRRAFALLAATPLIAVTLTLAACGSSSRGKTTSAPAPSTSAPSGTVDIASNGLGKILVDSQGRTLYLFQADTGTKSTCSGACAAAWHPLVTTGSPTAGGGVKASLIGTSMRSDGTEQVTYKGHPLYLFTGDTSKGQTNGQGNKAFGALWYVLSPAGNQVTGSASSGGGSSSGGSSLGY